MRWKDLWDEFKGFAFKGNMLNLAVAVVIGNAFGAAVNSLVKDVIMPAIGYVVPGGGYRSWHIGPIAIGNFLGELVNLAIIAGAMFLVVVKLLGTVSKLVGPKDGMPETKECPRCLSKIPFGATRCPQCTSDLPEEST